MSAPPQNQRDPARLNPFAFPSDTSFRFIILIMTIVSTSIFIYSSIYRKIPVNIQASTVVSQHCNDVAIQAAHSVLSQNGIYDTIYAKEFLDCIAPFDRIEILWITLGLGLLFSSALA